MEILVNDGLKIPNIDLTITVLINPLNAIVALI